MENAKWGDNPLIGHTHCIKTSKVHKKTSDVSSEKKAHNAGSFNLEILQKPL
jgi:hypothetical protein